jgi:hypothetical protein
MRKLLWLDQESFGLRLNGGGICETKSARSGSPSARRHKQTRTSKRTRAWAASALLALTGCATPQTRYVSTYCLTRTQFNQLKDAEPGKIHNQLNGDAAHDVGPLAGSAIRLRSWGEGLLTVLGGCIDPNTGAAH